jgi:hypothetical protein
LCRHHRPTPLRRPLRPGWSVPVSVDYPNAVDAVSCPSKAFCMTVGNQPGNQGYAASWNGKGLDPGRRWRGRRCWRARAGGLPVDTTVPGHTGNLFPGVASAFARHGFQVIARRKPDRPVMRRELSRPV